jgi:hypothetical protein
MSHTLTFKKYNIETKLYEPCGEATTYTIARAFEDNKQFAEFFGEYLNVGMKDYRCGEETGKFLRSEHRTVQGSLIRFCLGVICGMSEQEYTDARNETPVLMAKKIAQLVKDGELKMGYMI